jgi:cytoskeleton protein RodZ
MTETFKILASAHVIIQIGERHDIGVGMTSIGEKLRHQRLQNRISLERVSLETKIGVRLLEAIEAGQFEKLPGGVFRRSFVLQYARALDLDPDEIAVELNQLNQFDEVPALPTAETINGHSQNSGSTFSFRGDLGGLRGSTIGSLIAAVGVIMACALVYNWWQARPAANVETASVQPAARPVAVAPTSAAPPTPGPTTTAPTTTAPTAPVLEATAAPADAAHVRVGLSADEKTWISISSDGKNVFAQSLEPHETKIVEASAKVRLVVGNAGGVEISLNGKPIGPIGPRGQVRVVELSPAGFQIVPRKPPTLEPL